MFRRASVLAAVIASSALLSEFASAQTDEPRGAEGQQGIRPSEGRPGRPGRGGGELPSVEAAMKSMNRSLRQLNTQIDEALKRDENLRLLAEAQRACAAVKAQPIPADLIRDAKDVAAKARVTNAYRRDLLALMRKLLDAEQALLDGRTDEAATRLQEIQALRDRAHESLGVKDEDDRRRNP